MKGYWVFWESGLFVGLGSSAPQSEGSPQKSGLEVSKDESLRLEPFVLTMDGISP